MSEGSYHAPAHDWAATELGARSGWPHTLRLAVDLVLGSPAPSLLVWGPARIVVLNEAYAALAASRSVRAPGGRTPSLAPAPLAQSHEALERALSGSASVQRAQSVPFIRDAGIDMLQFDLYFTPVRDEADRVAGAVCALGPATREGGTGTALRILVVEDNLDSQYLVCEMLRALGHEVHGVAHAEDALAALARREMDVLFTDVSLPGMSGIELARIALERYGRMKIVFASGYGDTLLRKLEFPYVSLQKPYDLEQLQHLLGQIRGQLTPAR